MSVELHGEYQTEEERQRNALTVQALRYREVEGQEGLNQWFQSLEAPNTNAGRLNFGKTELAHLKRQYQDQAVDLSVRVVAYAKYHGRYQPGHPGQPQVICIRQAGSLRDELLPTGDTQPASRERRLKNAISKAVKNRQLDPSSNATRLVLPAGEWSTRRARF